MCYTQEFADTLASEFSLHDEAIVAQKNAEAADDSSESDYPWSVDDDWSDCELSGLEFEMRTAWKDVGLGCAL